MVKAGIPSSISEDTVHKLLQKTDLKWTHFQRKGIMSKNDLKLRLKFARKVYRKHTTCNNIWNMKSSESLYFNLHITTKSKICRWSLTYLLNSKEAGGKACKIWLKLRLHNGMETFQTLQTWIGYNATRNHKLNGLPHTRYHIFSLRFFWIWTICNALLSFI